MNEVVPPRLLDASLKALLSYSVHVIQRVTTVGVISPRSCYNRFIPPVYAYAYVGSVRKHRAVPCQKMMPHLSRTSKTRTRDVMVTENCTFRRLIVLFFQNPTRMKVFPIFALALPIAVHSSAFLDDHRVFGVARG
jgi:hypothetical protein